MITFSPGSYEGKNLCLAATQEQKEQPQSTVGDECNILSIGSNDQWGFEIDVMEKLSGCVTHTFDCTLKDNTPKQKPQNDNINFYPYCIGLSGVQGSSHLTYEKLCEVVTTRQNKTATKLSPPNLLKMDIEGFEFDVISMMLSSPTSLWPEQIMLEVHWATRMVGVEWMPRTLTAAEISLFFGTLFNHGGYIVVNMQMFEGCQPCLEVLLVRVVC